MNRNLKWTFWTFAFLICLAIPQWAHAQMACLDCDPQTSSCSESCWYCTTPHIDNWCPENEAEYRTCADYRGACMQDNCPPDWHEPTRVAQGTNGSGATLTCST